MSVHTDRAISLSALAFIFSELVQYQTIKICNANDLELALDRVGQTIGTKVLELLSYRERLTKREDGVISMLQVSLVIAPPMRLIVHSVYLYNLLESPVWQSSRFSRAKHRE